MSISIMGSINSYTKTMKLQTQWNLKQKNGDYNSHKKSLNEWLDTSQQALKKNLYGAGRDDDEEANKKLNDIMQKVYAGKKLSKKEKDFLKAKNPQFYEKLRSIEQEQKAFEQKLRQCKTKEEVQRLKMNQLASSMAIVGSVRNNSKIPQAKKLEICMQEKMRMDRVEESTRNFVNSGEYNRLPTEAEQARAIKEEKEKLEAALKPKDEQVKPPQTEESDQPEATEKPATTGQEANAPTNQTKPEPAKTETTASSTSKTKVTAKPIQAESDNAPSPELRKVRRARRQAAHAAYSAAAATADVSIQTTAQTTGRPALNINA